MKTTALLAAFTGLAAAIVAGPATAADKYAIDEQHVWAMYSIKHGPWANEMGIFKKVTGEINFDKADLSKSSVKVDIDVGSLDSNFGQRDKDLSSPDFFNTAEFPKMTFVSTKVEKTGDNTGKVTGDFTLLGVTKPIVLDVVFAGEAPAPWDAKLMRVGFSAKGTITPGDFGMAKVAEYGLGPTVSLIIEAEGNHM